MFHNFNDDLIDDDRNDGGNHDATFTLNFLSSNNDINVENCLCPK